MVHSTVECCGVKLEHGFSAHADCKLSEFKLKEVTREEMDKVAKAKIEANQVSDSRKLMCA